MLTFGYMHCSVPGLTFQCCLKSVWQSSQVVFGFLRFTFCNLLLVVHFLLTILLTAFFFTIFRVLHAQRLVHNPFLTPQKSVWEYNTTFNKDLDEYQQWTNFIKFRHRKIDWGNAEPPCDVLRHLLFQPVTVNIRKDGLVSLLALTLVIISS
jgi:hypothetical protein